MVNGVEIKKKTALFWIASPHPQLLQLVAEVLNNFGFINNPQILSFWILIHI